MKRVVSTLLLVVMLCSCFSISSMAATVPTVQPLWVNTNLVSGDIVFDGDYGYAGLRVVGKTGISHIDAYGVVYQVTDSGLEYITESSKTVTTMSCMLEIEFPADPNCEYQADFTFVVYKDGVGETIERTFTEVNS